MKNLLGIALGLSTLLSACSQTDKSASPEPAREESAMMAPSPSPVMAEAKNEESIAPPPAAPIAVAASTRLLIYHADVRLKVESLPQASARLDSLVRRSGGYLSAAEETRTEGQWRQEMTIRVKPRQFSGLMATIAGLGTVENKKLTTDDVTAEHADVSARLRTKRAVEQRYVALLSQARKIQDILDIEEKIGQVREEIESTESRLKTLNDEVAYSTITLTCYQFLPLSTPDAPVVSLGSRVVEAFYGGWSLLTSLLVGVVAIWPLLVLGALAGWSLRRWRFRRAQ